MEDMGEIDEDEDFDDDALKVSVSEDMSLIDVPVIEGYLMMQGQYFVHISLRLSKAPSHL